eukprot:2042976-Alexandrium_andersonii.AAC.1
MAKGGCGVLASPRTAPSSAPVSSSDTGAGLRWGARACSSTSTPGTLRGTSRIWEDAASPEV